MSVRLVWKGATRDPVEGPCLRPDLLAGLNVGALSRLRLDVEGQDATLADLFHVEINDAEAYDQLTIEGEMGRVRGIGAGMASGHLSTRGVIGPRLGFGMTGGTIEAKGDVGPWAGSMMSGGTLRIDGSAGDHLGAARPGERAGMRGGTILVSGDAGVGVGANMRRGLIAVAGAVGDDAGQGVIAGTILTFGPLGRRFGAGLKRGTIAALGPSAPSSITPGFGLACRYETAMLGLWINHLIAIHFPIPASSRARVVERYNGDLLEGGRGELLIGLEG
jgi:formylmethanofuran dehydrogenase subunit C